MATGKKAKDIFTKTAGKKKTGGKNAASALDIPKKESYQKVTVCLFDRQTIWLDKTILDLRERTGRRLSRAELIRHILDAAAGHPAPADTPFDEKDFERELWEIARKVFES